MNEDPAPGAPPPHVDDTVQAVLRLRDEHQARSTPAQRLSDRATAEIARPRFIVGMAVLIAIWIAWNIAAPRLGVHAFDKLPFDLLQGVATLIALFATVLILVTQRRDDQIGVEREHVALQLALLTDRKLAKLIALMEEQRRDDPAMRNRVDTEADEMAEPSDPRHVLDAMRDS